MPRILMVLSAASSLTLADGTSHPTGFWAEEVAEPHRLFTQAGVETVIATPGGTVPTVDALSLDERGGVSPDAAARYAEYLEEITPALNAPLVLEEVQAGDYDAVFLPGGHAPMADLAGNPDLAALLRDAVSRELIVAALCHGLAGLLSTRTPDGFLFADHRLTSFSDEEERQGGLGELSPFLLESSLREAGARLDTGSPWSSHVVVDGRLVTGQNPQSSAEAAAEVLRLLNG